MKKLVCVFLSFVLMLFALPFSAAAASGVTVVMENAHLQVGETVSLNITFNAGRRVQAFEYTLEYDTQVLTFVGVSDGTYNNYESGKIKYINIGNSTTDTVTVTFRAKAEGQTGICVTDIIAADTEEYTYSPVTYNFTVEKATRGDANGDGIINTIDLAALKLYLAGASAEIGALADYNGDSVIDTIDLASLKLYLAEG